MATQIPDSLLVSGGMPIGTIVEYAGTTPPSADWLVCDGTAVSRTTFAKLFTAIGETWGAGNGSTTFNLPDLRRRTAVGAGGNGTGTLGNAVGNTGGEEAHTLTVSEMPSHTHGTQIGGDGGTPNYPGPYSGYVAGGHVTLPTGGGGAHNNMQPSAVVNKLIKAQ